MVFLVSAAAEGAEKRRGKAEGTAPVDLTDVKPLTDLGTYEKDGKKFERGLYPEGKNEIPKAHLEAGLRVAKMIVPIDGEIVASSIGHSNPSAYFTKFEFFRRTLIKEGKLNPKFVLKNHCLGGKVCADWLAECKTGKISMDPKSQVLFMLTTYHQAGGRTPDAEIDALPFEKKMLKMKEDMIVILQTAAKECPNLKMAFVGSDVLRKKCEPRVYEEAYAIKWLIEEQIKGNPELAFEGPNRKAPWLAWGGYVWDKDAPTERFVGDGVHPSDEGKTVVAQKWLDTLLANPAARLWLTPEGK